MCGVAGYFRLDGEANIEDAARVARLTRRLSHRGPHGEGHSRLGSAVLGHRRLAIIDLSAAGRQPMANEDGTVWLTFNGEIYNFQTLRAQLLSRGHRFASQTDSEVILHGFEEWGLAGVLDKLRGMFAFALQDRRGGVDRLYLVRDRFGIKPLYYCRNATGVTFSSEVRALTRSGAVEARVNQAAWLHFLLWGSLPEPLTTVENVFALPAGCYAEVSRDGFRISRYYRFEDVVTAISPTAGQDPGDLESAVSSTRKALEETVRLHLVSDAPLGVFLSGGIDSSALLALASAGRDTPLATVSVVFDESDLSEARQARRMATLRGSDHHEAVVRDQDLLRQLPQVFEAMDQPTIDGVNTYFVSRAAAEAGLTVMLSGLGGDETFWGYRHFHTAHTHRRAWARFTRLPEALREWVALLTAGSARVLRKGALEKAAGLSKGTVGSLYFLYRGLFAPGRVQALLGISEKEVRATLEEDGRPEGPLLSALTVLEFNGYLKNQLLRDTDAMSMAHSLEVRVPFLDHVLVERVLATFSEWKLDARINKPLLVRALGDDLPREVWNRPKMGFTLPLDRWLRSHRSQLQGLSSEGRLDRKAVDAVWDDFAAGYAHWSQPWATLVASRFGA